MSNHKRKYGPYYLTMAREAAGYTSRDAATEAVPYSLSTIVRHESGITPITPESAVSYANGYRQKWILYQYCADCPVGKSIGRKKIDVSTAYAALLYSSNVRSAADGIGEVEKIAISGYPDNDALPDVVSGLHELAVAVDAILYCIEIEKGRPDNPEAAPHAR